MITAEDRAKALELLCGISPITDTAHARLVADERYQQYAQHLIDSCTRVGKSHNDLPTAVWANGRQAELPTHGRIRRARTALKALGK